MEEIGGGISKNFIILSGDLSKFCECKYEMRSEGKGRKFGKNHETKVEEKGDTE